MSLPKSDYTRSDRLTLWAARITAIVLLLMIALGSAGAVILLGSAPPRRIRKLHTPTERTKTPPILEFAAPRHTNCWAKRIMPTPVCPPHYLNTTTSMGKPKTGNASSGSWYTKVIA